MTPVLRRRALLLNEWDRWTKSRGVSQQSATAKDVLKFYIELEAANPKLLDFNPRGRDKWKIVYRWLEASGRVGADQLHH